MYFVLKKKEFYVYFLTVIFIFRKKIDENKKPKITTMNGREQVVN